MMHGQKNIKLYWNTS